MPDVRGALRTRREVAASYLPRRPLEDDQFVRFVILSRGRSGSNLLGSLLDAHPGVTCDGEILNRRRRHSHRFVDGRARASRARGDLGYGFKILSRDLWERAGLEDARPFLQAFHRAGYRFLLLHRRNPLRSAISYEHALRRGFKQRQDTQSPRGPLEVDIDRVIAWIAGEAWVRDYCSRSLEGIDHLTLTYEDDLADTAAERTTSTRVLGWLGLPDSPLEPGLRKQVIGPIEDQVSNLDELRSALDAHGYSDLLDR